MVEVASFRLQLTGGLSARHRFEGYDGYTALASAAWTLSLVTNYVETGKIRHRGNFVGRHAVIAEPMKEGSLIADFSVILQSQPKEVFAIAGGGASLLYGLVKRVVQRNTGFDSPALNDESASLIEGRSGDVEALVAATEPSLRRAHEVIGPSANRVQWFGGFTALAELNPETKAYIKDSFHDEDLYERDVSVSGFYGNSGQGSVYDISLGRNIHISMSRETLVAVGTVFSWGLDQYLKQTGNTIRIKFSRILSSDNREKRYIIHHAAPTRRLD